MKHHHQLCEAFFYGGFGQRQDLSHLQGAGSIIIGPVQNRTDYTSKLRLVGLRISATAKR